MTKLIPLYDRVLVEPHEEKKSHIIEVVEQFKEPPLSATVLSVGQGKLLASGELRPLMVQVGAKVQYGRHAGVEVKYEGKTLRILKEEDLLGVIEE